MPQKRVSAAEKARAEEVFTLLAREYPGVRCTLDYDGPFQLLVMTILAAQCTDARVNIVCRDLFRKYRGPADFAAAPAGELERDILPCGFFNQKARCIRESSRMLLEEHGGEVPGDMDALLRLPGVGRKIANAVMGECFGAQGVIVDTHCRRVAGRLGFTRNTDPGKIEQDLRRLWPPDRLTLFSHFMVFHGRAVCSARSPQCGACCVAELCPKRGVNPAKPAKKKAT
ncbi:MAG: endonuclease III [Candidatus Hydrogenedens sp.]|nr:endonuclease III [Candidatus Hydrogenedentota bacterium]NLF59137.1 endonuclease III [Candidatus Hydrogenedens sp.]